MHVKVSTGRKKQKTKNLFIQPLSLITHLLQVIQINKFIFKQLVPVLLGSVLGSYLARKRTVRIDGNILEIIRTLKNSVN